MFAILALLAWLYLAFLHGRFWQKGPILAPAYPKHCPPVTIVVPARDEADSITASITSLLAQDYAGAFRIVLVDDNSTDATAVIARALPGNQRLTVITGVERPNGWAGKLWAVSQGIAATNDELVLLTDADITHDSRHLSTLVAKMERSGVDMVSEMVALRCEDWAERALIPAFVYFFAMLYPFAWVADPTRATAGAAGGTVLIRRTALERIGGIAAIKGDLIDDCALAAKVKPGGRIWLGHSMLARSIRPYPHPRDVWKMIARSAYVQLKLSPWLLAASTLGMFIMFLAPPLLTLHGSWLGALGWAIMAATFVPTLRRFGLSLIWAPLLPAIALFYMAATLGSAWDHHRGRGVVWKSRAYSETSI
jgi:hopene-associated glycosyltransferase HpnB